MPSNFTENYRLSQWEKSDKVLMDDFNADNANIDAAIRGAYPVLLKSWTSSESSKTLELDISGIEWTKYAWVVLEIYFPEKSGFLMNINGGGQYFNSPSGGSSFDFCCMNVIGNLFRMICPVFYRDDLPLRGFAMVNYFVVSASNLPLRELKLLTLNSYNPNVSPSTLSAGTEFKIWGTQ